MSDKKIKLDFSTEDVMKKQRETICIKGQEVPTWQFIWRQFHVVETKMRKLNVTIVALGLFVIILAIAVISGKL